MPSQFCKCYCCELHTVIWTSCVAWILGDDLSDPDPLELCHWRKAYPLFDSKYSVQYVELIHPPQVPMHTLGSAINERRWKSCAHRCSMPTFIRSDARAWSPCENTVYLDLPKVWALFVNWGSCGRRNRNQHQERTTKKQQNTTELSCLGVL